MRHRSLLLIRIITAATLTTATASLPAQTVPKEIRCLLEVSSTEILPFEPLNLVVCLTNASDREIQFTYAFWPVARIGVPNEKEIKWVASFHYGGGPPLPPKKTHLKAGEQIRLLVPVHNAAPIPQQTPVQKPGVIYVQGIETVQDQPLESDPARVTVLEPQGEDAQAFEYLRSTGMKPSVEILPESFRKLFAHESPEELQRRVPPLYMFFSGGEMYGRGYGPRLADELLKFAQLFPNSQYSQYAKLGAGLIWIDNSCPAPDVEKAVTLFEEATTGRNAQAAALACIQMGRVAEKKGNHNAARDYFQRAVEYGVSPYFKRSAQELMDNIKQASPQ